MAIKYLSSIDLNKNQLQSARLHNLATDPSATTNGDQGLLYYNTGDSKIYVWNGTAWVDISGDIKSVASSTQDQLTVLGPNGPNPLLSIVTADVAENGTGLTKSGQVYSYLFGDNQRITVQGTTNEVEVSTDNTANDKLQLGNTLTVGLPDDVTIGNDLTVTQNASVGANLTVTGNLTVNGTTTTVNSTTVTIDDPVFTLGGDTAPTADDNKDRGIEFRYHDGSNAKLGFFGFDDSTGRYTFLTSATNSAEVFSGTKADLDIANIYLSGSIKSVNGNTPADGQLLIGSAATGDMQLATLTAGDGIDVTNTAGAISIAAETASTSNAGVVELATTAEALAGTNTTKAVTPAGLAARSFLASIGDGAATAITVTHSLGTKDVLVQMYETATGDTVISDVQRNTVNTIIATFATPPASGAIKILVTKID